MSNPTLTIGARALAGLVRPVTPFASNDLGLPVLNTVRIESRGKYLLAITTDRFRLTAFRLARTEGEWPEFAATIPLPVLKSIQTTFKPSVRGMDVDLDLTITDDGDVLEVTAAGGLIDLLGATTRYRLETGEWPVKALHVIADAIARAPEQSAFGVNPAFLADYGRIGLMGQISVKTGKTSRDPIVVTDGEDFVSVLMPRRMQRVDGLDFPTLDGWADLLVPPAPKKATKKGAAA